MSLHCCPTQGLLKPYLNIGPFSRTCRRSSIGVPRRPFTQSSASCGQSSNASSSNCGQPTKDSTQNRRDALLATAAAVLAVQGPAQASTSVFEGSRLPASRIIGRPAQPVAELANVEDSRSDIETVETVELGKSGVKVTPIGVGAWSWGDRSGYWGYGNEYQRADNFEAYKTVVDTGVTFIDTAEVYGFGLSESFLGEFMKETNTRPVIATKFAPLPWRFRPSSVVSACRASLERLQLDQVGLYMMHWPGFITNALANDAFVEGLAECHRLGLARAVGVSNFNAKRVNQAARILQDRGVPLASNQVQYSLLYRTPETNGVADACRKAGATMVAYSPLAQGLLTGKYSKDKLPSGARGAFINADRVAEVQPLLGLMRDIGSGHGGKSPTQVAINWCICKGALPIPGAKNARQVREAAGGFGWRMSPDEVAALDAETAKIGSATGAPFENW